MKFYNTAWALCDVKPGVVVRKRNEKFYGHIVSFSRLSTGELGVLVTWEDGSIRPIHPANISIVGSDEM